MTTCITRRTVRLSAAHVRNRGKSKAVIVILEPPGDAIALRLKGERKTYRLPLSLVYTLAVQQYVLAEKARKRQARKGKRK